MNNYIKNVRFSKGLSQETLSQKSALPLWHIQLIENNVIYPSDNDLQKLSIVLNVDKDSLIYSKSLDSKQLLIIYFSIFTMFFIPYGNIIGPSYYLSTHFNLSSFVRNEGNKFINFQLGWSIFLTVFIVFLTIDHLHLDVSYIPPYSLWFSLIVLILFNIFYTINKVIRLYIKK
ncbi:DUF4870 domain-containing protein [Flammeovirga pacifica]|uniref:HTH cro/C1-type domain-containing protein n=1 Tax=Flammeovirga pacifica TaxID=915059 RepID=A0A1S1YT89_FLAPC|nr:DUF4870 domain-containing protein [Flammeovirga pacifica]OHX64254.1 hypothetical protein NH26_21880 [Flammeovirga pacifica]